MIVSNEEAAVFCGDASLAGDESFQAIVAGVDAQVKDFLDRDLEFARRIEYPAPREGRRSSVIRLREWPIAAVIEVRVDITRAFADSAIVDLGRFIHDPSDNELRWLDSYFPNGIDAYPLGGRFDSETETGRGAIRVTYDAGYLTADNTDYPDQPRMPANARLGTLKQIKLEYESGGAVLMSETLGDHMQTFALPSIAGAVILEPTVKALLRSLKRYA